MEIKHLTLFSDDELERLHEGAVTVLHDMGVKIENYKVLDLLEKKGAKIDRTKQVALLPRNMLEETIELQHKENYVEKVSGGLEPPKVSPGLGGMCPLIFDYQKWERRPAIEKDLIEMLQLVDSLPEVTSLNPPVIDSTCPPEIEAIKSIVLMLENAPSKCPGGVDLFYPEQVKYMAELGEIYEGNPGRFLPYGNCLTSPLIFPNRIVKLAIEKAKYGVNFAVPTMPISGVNAPVTRAGTIVIGLAEILAGWTMAKCINPSTPVSSTSISGILDMATGAVIFCSPEVIVQDIGIYEVCKRFYGAKAGIYPSYIDGKVPGMQTMYEKTFKQMAMAQFAYYTGHDGSLDAAKVFSPTQLMIDIEMNEVLCQYLKEIEINKDTLAIDLIKEIKWEPSGYLSSGHTLKHFKKELWFPKLLDRAVWKSDEDEKKKESRILERADELWRSRLNGHQPAKIDKGKRKAFREVLEKAEKNLVGKCELI